MRALIVGDIHLHRKKLSRSIELLQKIKESVKIHKPDALILLGDVFDHHRELYSDLCTIFHEFLESVDVPVHILVGNHDMQDSRTYLPRFHALQSYKRHPNVNVCDAPSTICIEDGTIIGFVPFVPNGFFKRAIDGLEETPHIVFAHQEFKDCLMSSFKSEHGDDNPQMNVISGHIHGEQTVGNVWYPGTPCQQNFAEDEEKNIFLIEINGGSYKIVSKIDLDMPKYISVKTSTEEFPILDQESKNLYRIIVKGSPEKIVMYKQTQFYKTMNRLVKFKFDIERKEAVRTEITKNYDFESRFIELIQQSDLLEVYENIFTKL